MTRADVGGEAPGRPVRVLFVCTGNICRSPTAEGVLRTLAVERGWAVEVDSAGLEDWHVGEPPDPRSCRHAQARGYSIDDLRARQLTAADFEAFDLVIALDEDHHARLQARCPAPHRGKLRRLGAYAGLPDGTGVPDPYDGNAAAFEQVLDLVEAGCHGLLAELAQWA